MSKSWTLNDALVIIRQIQPLIRKFNYHVAIGGSLINNGLSGKDADLYFLPLNNGEENKIDELKQFLDLIWGKSEPMRPTLMINGEPVVTDYLDSDTFQMQEKYTVEGRRIDVFIV